MFSYNDYIKKYKNIELERYKDNCKGFPDLNKFMKFHRKREKKINELNKSYNIIFIHELLSAWMEFIEKIIIIDAEKDNVIIISNNFYVTYTINYLEIQKLKEMGLSCNSIFKINNVLSPTVMDGTMHKIYISDNKRYKMFNCANLWYWYDEKNINKSSAEPKKVVGTKELINYIKLLQTILEYNNIKFKILKNIE